MCAKDSRDKWSNYVLRDPNDSTKPLKLTIYDYSAPKIQNASAFRCNETGVAMDNGTHLSVGCSGVVGASIGGRNGVSVVYQWKIVGDEYSAKASIPTEPISGFPVTNTFEVKFTVKDTIGTETIGIISIPLGKTDFHLTPHGAGLGMYHDSSKPNTLQCDWDIEMHGRRILGYYGYLGNTNLNDIKEFGVYFQNENIEATSDRNYPMDRAGWLETFREGKDGTPYVYVLQRYTAFAIHDLNGYFIRTYNGFSWSSWKKVSFS